MKVELPKFDMRGKKTQIFPNAGEVIVQCSKCSGRAFQVHVRPSLDGGADVSELVCIGCLHTSRVQRKHPLSEAH